MSKTFEQYEELIEHIEHIQKMRYQAIRWAFAAQKELSAKIFKSGRDEEQSERLNDLTDSLYEHIPYQVWEDMRDNYDKMVADSNNVMFGTALYDPADPSNVNDINLYTGLIKEAATMESVLSYVQPTEPIDPNFDSSLYSFTGVFKKEVK